jgi:hypothetical protein
MPQEKIGEKLARASAQTISAAKRAVANLRMPTAVTRKHVTTEQDLLNLESELGRAVFGRTPNGLRREFFYHRDNTWIYHEEEEVLGKELTITYEVFPDRVVKITPNRKQLVIEGTELDNFIVAVKTYEALLDMYLYQELDESQ